MPSTGKHARSEDETSDLLNGSINGFSKEPIISSIPTVPVTVERKPFVRADSDTALTDYGTPRANIAPDATHPRGTTEDGWAVRHRHQTVLQQHCEFFDTNNDGVIWPIDTYIGFRKLGFNLVLSILAVFVIHGNFSYPTVTGWLPDPFFRLFLNNIHKDKHGSDSGTYDTEGRFVPQKFEDMFAKYADGKDSLSIWDVGKMLKGQRLILDPIGWSGAFFEWAATYIMLWPEDGRMKKEDIRGMYDGSIFYKIAARKARNEPVSSGNITPIQWYQK